MRFWVSKSSKKIKKILLSHFANLGKFAHPKRKVQITFELFFSQVLKCKFAESRFNYGYFSKKTAIA